MNQELLLRPTGTFDAFQNAVKKNPVMKWLDRNLINMVTERRLTTDLKGRPMGAVIEQMHDDNIRRIKHAYRHPFERIPEEYYEYKYQFGNQNFKPALPDLRKTMTGDSNSLGKVTIQ